jgi:hypothetical protein
MLYRNPIAMSQFFSYTLVFIFSMLLPFQEWPDANIHWERGGYYVQIIKYVQEIMGILEPDFIYNQEHSAFFSGLWTSEKFRVYSLNLVKIPFVFAIIFFINKISIHSTGSVLIFSPPLIFSLMTISLEPLAIFFTFLSYFLIYQKKILLPIAIGFIATLVDRSMIVNYLSIIILILYFNLKSSLFYKVIFTFILFIFFLFFSNDISYFLLDNWSFYGLNGQDILYNKEFGGRNILSLLATISGLYGWVSIRPEPWVFYYLINIILFLIGFFICNNQKKLEFFIFLIPVLVILSILPPVSQARYYPILTLIYWQMVWFGFNFFLKSNLVFCLLFTLMTFSGIVLSHI